MLASDPRSKVQERIYWGFCRPQILNAFDGRILHDQESEQLILGFVIRFLAERAENLLIMFDITDPCSCKHCWY